MEKSTQISTASKYQEGPQYISLSVILLDSVFISGKNHYPQVFLEECKIVIKEKIYSYKYITVHVEILLMKKLCWRKFKSNKILRKKILMKKTVMKKIK